MYWETIQEALLMRTIQHDIHYFHEYRTIQDELELHRCELELYRWLMEIPELR